MVSHILANFCSYIQLQCVKITILGEFEEKTRRGWAKLNEKTRRDNKTNEAKDRNARRRKKGPGWFFNEILEHFF